MDREPRTSLSPRDTANPRDELLAVLLLVVATLAALWPIWCARFLPLLDDANHLSALTIWSGLRDPASPLHRFYEPRFELVPYFLHYGLGYVASYAVNAETAHKLALSVYVIGFPVAAVAWCRRTQHALWLAAGTPMLAFGVSWAHGYHAFNLGIPVYLLAVSAFDRLLSRFTWRDLWWCLLATAACYLSHAVIVGLLVATVTLLALIHRPSRASALASVSLMASVLSVFVWESQRSIGGGSQWIKLLKDMGKALSWKNLTNRMESFTSYAFDVVSGPWDERLGLASLCLLLCLHVLALARGRRAQRIARSVAPSVFPHAGGVVSALRLWALRERSSVLALAFGIAYLITPKHLAHPEYMWLFAARLVPVVLFFSVLSVSSSVLRWQRAVAVLWVMSLLALTLVVGDKYRQFNASLQPLSAALATCPADQDVLSLSMHPRTHDAVNVAVMGGLAGWVQVLRGGFDPYYFVRKVPFPFAVKHKLPAPRFRDPARYRDALRKGKYECVLTYRFKKALAERGYHVEFEAGDFRMWRRDVSRDSAGPTLGKEPPAPKQAPR